MSKGITAWVLGWLLVLAFGITAVHAADLTYTQPLQNVTQSLTGQGITSDTYFVKEDYWDVQQAKLIFHYQVSQLADQRTSDITVVLNGVKFASFRPKNAAGLQTETIQIPLRLLAGSNHLQFMGQVLTTAAGTSDPFVLRPFQRDGHDQQRPQRYCGAPGPAQCRTHGGDLRPGGVFPGDDQ
ncbi:cellulose biosynthesis cyclic di-GMP-binding regulatory protein BcsB [Schleiferilactobacillus harbinensis]|uniref:cellulose biosynthesis cyclic di-GMP-binding regulatory protein BcsB n=1 Tax=Schleiferilactobacillus harbinensis TaxID=304207 RepID=UPI001F355F16|nr:cellulose biosynthesis cyclic di-GMP-binding regulatory protein BcsB [Schleiferilactobacillus harbinensis]